MPQHPAETLTLPHTLATADERRRGRIAGSLSRAFIASGNARGVDPHVASLAAHAFVEWHLECRGDEQSFSNFDVVGFAKWIPAEAVLHPELLPYLTEAWLGFTHFLVEDERLDEVSGARLRRDFHLAEPGIIAALADRYASLLSALEGA
jgi:hypothetical protein